MARPNNAVKFPEIEAKLGIKSSVPNVKSVLALLILLYECNNEPDKLEITEQVGTAVKLETSLERTFKATYNPYYSVHGVNDTDFDTLVAPAKNALIGGAKEHLEVALELIWQLAKIEFVDSTKIAAKERTTDRFAKIFYFSANMDVIHSMVNGSDKTKYIETLLHWLGLNTPIDVSVDENLCKTLTAMSETALYRMLDGANDVIFNLNEVYKALNVSSPVNISGDAEAKGSLRILKNIIKENVNPYVESSGSNDVQVKAGLASNMAKYQSRVNTLLSLKPVKIPSSTPALTAAAIKYAAGYIPPIRVARNRIVFGAPGTGKSYTLNEDRKTLLAGDDAAFERVTFHADYSYSQFVGTYKPVSSVSGEISYTFVPGPFMNILVKAYKNILDATDNAGNVDVTKIKPYLLLIEEINRAHTAAVFGDVFQLLDRDDAHISEYEIQPSEEIKEYLAQKLGGSASNYPSIKLPDNMFIWSTMNSADQGVFPMDTAFKRRWEFKYIGVDEEEFEVTVNPATGRKVATERQTDTFNIAGETIDWNVLRRAINAKLSNQKIKAHEDKLMGPFFLKIKDKSGLSLLTSGDPDKEFIELFCNKVLMYLFEDAAKTKRADLFEGIEDKDKVNRYSYICDQFRKNGIKIFGPSFYKDATSTDTFYKKQEKERDDTRAEKEKP